ncbi:MAG: flagellar FlbD family protein [Fimbriimonadaceae bacterium]|nr:flagellar FlbD family protein [Fimbriimonadaceae bacterium]
MIKLHRLDGSQFVLNAELIETIEATPNTVLKLTNSKVYLVRESVDQVLSRCLSYRRSVFEHLAGHPLGILPSRWAAGQEDEANP